MKLLILSLCVSLALCDVSHVVGKGEEHAEILKQELDVGPDGSYKYAYETQNGISASEQGQLKPGLENPAIAVEGEAKWISPEGETIEFRYIADENGYQAQGPAIPTPPPIPEAILRGLQYIRDHPPPPEKP